MRFRSYVSLVFAGLLTFNAAAARTLPKPTHHKRIRSMIVVNKANNTMKLYVTGHRIRRFPVSTGKRNSTPEGTFRVIQRTSFPGPDFNQFGPHWLGLNTLGKRRRHRIGIHGTNEPQAIGQSVSHGCIRLRNHDIDRVFGLVPLGTRVKIVRVVEKRRHLSRTPKRKHRVTLARVNGSQKARA